MNTVRRLVIRSLSLAALCALGNAMAGTNSLPPELAIGALSSPAWVITNALTVTTNRFPNADLVLVDEYGRVAYKPDGTSVSVVDDYSKVLTEKGCREQAVQSFLYMANYETLPVVSVDIYKPDGRRLAIDPASNSCVMIDSGQMGANIYDKQMKVLQVSVPGLEVSDLLHVRVLRTTVKAIVPDTWSEQALIEGGNPIVHLIYEVVSPDARPLSWACLRSPIDKTVTYSRQPLPNGRTCHRWVAWDVPQLFPEPRIPDVDSVAQRVLVSTIPDWAALSRWYWKLCQPRLDAVTPEMRETVSNLVAGVTGREERISRIFTFVSQKIRYMGITVEDVAPGFEPHDASLTFGNRYGVCRDKAALLVSMLRLAGIEAYPVLIVHGAKLDPDVPMPNFNHAIVAVARPGGYLLMDPTNESTRDPCPAYLGNCSYLVAHPAGETLRVSEVAPAESNMMHIASRGSLDENGTLALDIQLAFEGINDNTYRSQFLRQKPDERRRYFEELLKRRFPGAELTAFRLEPADLMQTAVPLTARLGCRVRHYPVAGEGVTLLEVPWLATTLGSVNSLFRDVTLQTRKYVYLTTYACGVDETLNLEINSRLGRVAEIPHPLQVEKSGVGFDMGLCATNGGLAAHMRYVSRKPEYVPAEYVDLKQVLRDMETAVRQGVVLESEASEKADLHSISDDLELDVLDAHTWVRTRTVACQILTYAGKKRYGEMAIPFASASGTAELVSGTVSNRDGTVHVVSPREINVMDQEWVAGARRYPAGKVYVVSLPGLEVGSVVRTTYRREYRDRPFFSHEQAFAGEASCDAMSLTVRVPLNIKLRVETRFGEPLSSQCTTNDGKVVYRWKAGPFPATADEPNQPPYYLFNPTVLLSAGEWSSYAGQLDKVFESAVSRQPAACEKARSLVAGLGDDRARVKAIRDYVARSVRDGGPSFLDLSLACLTPADTVLADGYGHAADRAILLTAMLRGIGIGADVLLTSGSPFLAPGTLDPVYAFPQDRLFDDVMVRIKMGSGGGSLYLNDSDEYGVLGTTRHEGFPFLALNGETGRVAVAEAYRERTRAERTFTLETNGLVTIEVTNWFYGAHCGDFRRQYAELRPEDRDRHFQALVAGVSQSATAVGGLTTDLQGYPGYEAFKVRVDGYAVRQGRTLTLHLPDFAAGLSELGGDERVTPFHVENPSDAEWLCRVILPPGVRAVPVLPAAFAWPLPEGMGRVSFDVTRSTLPDGRICITLRRAMQIRPAILEPTLYPALLEINRRLSHPSLGTIMAELQ